MRIGVHQRRAPAVPAETPRSHRTDGLTWPRTSCGTNSAAAKSTLNDKFYTMHQPEADAVSGASPVQGAAALPGGGAAWPAIESGGKEWLKQKKITPHPAQKPRQRQGSRQPTHCSAGEKRARPTTRRPYYNRRPRRAQQPKEAATPIHIYPLAVWARSART